MRLLSLSADGRPDPHLRKEPNMLKICIRKMCEGCGLLAVETKWGGFIKVFFYRDIFPLSALQKCRAFNVLRLYPLPGAERCCKLICDTQRNIFLPPTEIFCATYRNSSATHRNIFLPPIESLFVPTTKLGSAVTLDPSLLTRALLCILPLVSYV